jgi:hypothetical protein
MKAFLVGLLTLVLMAVLVGLGSVAWIFLIPVLLVMGLILRVLIALFIVLLAVWLLGKLVLFLFGKLKSKV